MTAEQSLRSAFDEHYASLVKMCILLTNHRETAEDIAQDAFVRIAGRIEHLDPQHVRSYLYKTAVNLWKNRLRRSLLERRMNAMRNEQFTEADSSFEDRDALWRTVMELPHRQRACLVLRFYEDLPEQEVAQVMRCSVGTVKSQTSRALAKLRRKLR